MAQRKRPVKKKAAAGSSRGKSKKRTVSVDFEGVESRVTLPEDDYHLKVEEVTQEEGNEYDYLKWKFKTVHSQTNLNNKPVYNNTSLAPQALWNLRNLLEAIGIETPDSAYDIDLDGVEGMEFVGSIEHEEYEDNDGNSKTRMSLVDYMPLSDSFSEGGVVEDEDESDEDADESDEDESDEDEDESEEDESDEDESDDGEEEDDAITEADVMDMNAEDLAEVVEAYELEVEFKGMRSLRKKQNAIVEALKEAEYID